MGHLDNAMPARQVAAHSIDCHRDHETDRPAEFATWATVSRRVGGVEVEANASERTPKPLVAMPNVVGPTQKILFGSPGVGKSYMIEHALLPELGVDANSDNCVKAVFHPEYTYGDFMGKLLPLTRGDGRVEYNFYEGHFLRALARAYRCVLDNPESPAHVALVIDELNRGNSAAIFGSVFQLLDRDDQGWSSYYVTISQMEFEKLIELIGVDILSRVGQKGSRSYRFNSRDYTGRSQGVAAPPARGEGSAAGSLGATRRPPAPQPPAAGGRGSARPASASRASGAGVR